MVRPGTSSSGQSQVHEANLPQLDKIKQFKEMANAFDEIIIEEEPTSNINVVIVEEG